MIFYILLCVAIVSTSKINLEYRFIRESPPYDIRDRPGMIRNYINRFLNPISVILLGVLSYRSTENQSLYISGDCYIDGCKICTLNIANGYGFADAQNCTIIAKNIRVTTHWKEWCPIKFRCMKGYVLEGKHKYICINGNWTSQDGISRSSDPDPPSCKYFLMSFGFEYQIFVTND